MRFNPSLGEHGDEKRVVDPGEHRSEVSSLS
jgi:hypothetical protein